MKLTAIPASGWEKSLLALIGHRMSAWLYLTVALVAAVWFFAPHMLSVLLWKGTLLSIAAYLGYWICRAIEQSSARPHELQARADSEMSSGDPERAWQLEQLAAASYQRRAWVIAACLIAAAIGT